MRKCRYCSHLITGNGIWCEAHQREYSEKYTKTPNNCGDFELNVIDAYDLNRTYQPREARPEVDDNQITFADLGEIE